MSASPHTPTLLPPDDDLDLLHTRTYEVRAYRLNDTQMLVRGAISDVKPPGLYVSDDPEPLEFHRMQIQLTVELPALEIVAAQVGFEAHPHTSCTAIVDAYQQLVGLNIARGFTHKVRELFGGPRGCAHTTALLQAMAPAAVQSIWSMRMQSAQESGTGLSFSDPERREMSMRANMNTCHVWDENGETVAAIRRGDKHEAPLPITERLVRLGRDPENWTAENA